MTAGTTGKVIVHIGPPRTATTSLQYTLQKQEVPGFVYGGVTQPRGPRAELSFSLHGYCSAQEPIAIDDLRSEISAILSSGRHLVISEEMFLFDQKARHQEKLARLAAVLSGFPVSILITARDPVKALCSFYREFSGHLPFLQRLSFRAFLRGNQAKVYDYDHLARTLQDVGFADVRFMAFDVLVSGSLSYDQLLERPGRSQEKVVVPHENPGRTSNPGEHGRRRAEVSSVTRPCIVGRRIRPLIVPDAIAKDLRSKFGRVAA